MFTYSYAALPVLCFLVFYMRSLWGVLFGLIFLAALVLAIYDLLKKDKTEDKKLEMPKGYFIAFFIIAVIWTFLAGIGNHYVQSSDWGCRNAIFRDLVYQKWPVYYDGGENALVYYIGYWLPSATITKIIAKVLPQSVLAKPDILFTIGNQFLWLWTAIGIFILFLLFLMYVKPATKQGFMASIAVLVFFSGMDIIGVIYSIVRQEWVYDVFHLEWYNLDGFQFSSITTCLFWVFNQAVISWIVTLAVINEEKISTFMFLGVCAFMSGPLPFLGIFVYMISIAIAQFIKSVKEKTIPDMLKNMITPVNILAFFAFPAIALYYKGNAAVAQGAAERAGITLFGFLKVVIMGPSGLIKVFLFLLIECLIILGVLYKAEKRNLIYWITLISLIIAPFCTVGTASDFVMRFSIPAIITMAAMSAKYLFGDNRENALPVARTILIIVLLIGSITPLTEYARGLYTIMTSGRIAVVFDDQKTLEGSRLGNFVAEDCMEQPFFKYLAGK